MSDTPQIDHEAVGRSRVTQQYKDKTKFLAYLAALAAPFNNIEQALQDTKSIRDIDEAEGAQLDIIGEIVGASRIIDVPIDGSTVLSDADFRLLIRARIIRNHSKGTPEEILAGCAFILQQSQDLDFPIVIGDPGGMVMNIAIGRDYTDIELAMILGLDILPRPMAVRLNEVVSFDPENYFGFEGQPGALGFDDEDVGGVAGGPLAEEHHI